MMKGRILLSAGNASMTRAANHKADLPPPSKRTRDTNASATQAKDMALTTYALIVSDKPLNKLMKAIVAL